MIISSAASLLFYIFKSRIRAEKREELLAMKILLKILLAPAVAVLTFIIWIFTLVTHISAVILNVLSVLLAITSIIMFAAQHNIGSGIAFLVIAFLLSPYGLPMAAAWLIAQLIYFRDWIKEAVY